jgi:DNA-binding MarR family transcriptional regulator
MSVRLEASDVEALTRILGSLAVAKEWAAEPGNTERQFAQILFNARKARARMFPASMFSEPAWDMLLALFIADEVPAAADLARWIDAPLTTAMRWLGYLEDHKLISRESSPADKRAHRIRLTDRARCNMQQLFSEVMSEWPLD